MKIPPSILLLHFRMPGGPVTIQLLHKYIAVYLSVPGATIVTAHVSYRYFEKYFMDRKEKFMVVRSSAIRDVPADGADSS